MKHAVSSALSLVLLAAAAVPAAADPVRESATKVFAERQDSVLRLTVTRNNGKRDLSFEAPALALDGKDLLVTSLSRVESPGGAMAAIARMGGRAPAGAKGELNRVAMFMADGSEAEADLVLTDPDLDLAFLRVRPVDGEAVKLAAAAPAAARAELLDEVLAIGRTGPQLQREAIAGLIEIAGVVETPRLLYVPASNLQPGEAVFTLAGELLGIGAGVNGAVVIVPATKILELAATAPAAKEAAPSGGETPAAEEESTPSE